MGSKNVTVDVLDTNVLIRFLLGDIPEQQERAKTWFREAREKKRVIVILPIVIAETAFVLKKFYKKDVSEISDVLETFISQKWLSVKNRRELLTLWPWYRAGLHFVDSFILSWAHVHKANILT